MKYGRTRARISLLNRDFAVNETEMAQIFCNSTRKAATNDLTTDKQNVSSPQTKNSHFEDYSAVPVCETAVSLGAAKILLTLGGLFR